MGVDFNKLENLSKLVDKKQIYYYTVVLISIVAYNIYLNKLRHLNQIFHKLLTNKIFMYIIY